MQLLPIYKKWILFIAVLIALVFATPVLADYLGPNRTETVTVETCNMVRYECKQVNGRWRYKRTEDWSCPTGHDACEGGDKGDCDEGNHSGGPYCSREYGTKEVITTLAPATITGTIENCTAPNGWCMTPTNLALLANEPLVDRGKVILLIEGRFNGVTFACPSDTPSPVMTCSIGLQEGQNDFEYWALSSWGDSSEKGYSSARVDTVPPDVGLDISGVSGTNGWYVSDTTVTAAGADATSGVASMLLTIDGGANWQPSLTLEEGVYTVTVSVTDNAGHESHSSTPVAVDTTTPSISMSVAGTLGNYGWYKSDIQVTATATDATSGIATFEVSADGGAYQTYTPITFSDGHHTIRFKAVDVAGNLTETPLQEFSVDTIPPVVDLPGSWQLGRDVSYEARDAGSGLLALRIVIEDEDEKYAKLAMDRDASGSSYASHLDWNGEFRNQTVAPPGTYLVWIKAADKAGHEHFELGRVIVPQPNVLFNLLPTEEPLVSADLPLPPAELSETVGEPPAGVPPVFDFGGGTSESTGTTEGSTQSVLLSTGTGPAAATSSPGILWGGAAAAAIAAATAYALEETRKRKEAEEAQAAAVRAEIARDKAKDAEKGLTKEEKKELKAEQSRAHDAKVQERKEREERGNLSAEERAQLKWEEERDAAYAQQVYRDWLVQEELKKQQEELAKQQAGYVTPPGIPSYAGPVNLHGDTTIPPLPDNQLVYGPPAPGLMCGPESGQFEPDPLAVWGSAQYDVWAPAAVAAYDAVQTSHLVFTQLPSGYISVSANTPPGTRLDYRAALAQNYGYEFYGTRYLPGTVAQLRLQGMVQSAGNAQAWGLSGAIAMVSNGIKYGWGASSLEEFSDRTFENQDYWTDSASDAVLGVVEGVAAAAIVGGTIVALTAMGVAAAATAPVWLTGLAAVAVAGAIGYAVSEAGGNDWLKGVFDDGVDAVQSWFN